MPQSTMEESTPILESEPDYDINYHSLCNVNIFNNPRANGIRSSDLHNLLRKVSKAHEDHSMSDSELSRILEINTQFFTDSTYTLEKYIHEINKLPKHKDTRLITQALIGLMISAIFALLAASAAEGFYGLIDLNQITVGLVVLPTITVAATISCTALVASGIGLFYSQKHPVIREAQKLAAKISKEQEQEPEHATILTSPV